MVDARKHRISARQAAGGELPRLAVEELGVVGLHQGAPGVEGLRWRARRRRRQVEHQRRRAGGRRGRWCGRGAKSRSPGGGPGVPLRPGFQVHVQKDRRDGRLVARGDPELRVGGRVDVARHQRVDDRGPEACLGGLHQRERGRPGEARARRSQHTWPAPGEGVEVDQGLCRVGGRHEPRRSGDDERRKGEARAGLRSKGGGRVQGRHSSERAHEKQKGLFPKLAGESCRGRRPPDDRPGASLLQLGDEVVLVVSPADAPAGPTLAAPLPR